MKVEKKIKSKKHWIHKGIHHGHKFLVLVGFLTMISGLMLTAFAGLYAQTIVPGVKIVGLEVGKLKAEEAADLVKAKVEREGLAPIKLVYKEREWEIKPEEVGAEVLLAKTAVNAWMVARQGSIFERLGEAQRSYFEGIDLPLEMKVDEEKWNTKVNEIAQSIDEEEIRPSLQVTGNREIKLVAGRSGYMVEQELLKAEILDSWSKLEGKTLLVPVTEILVDAREEEARRAVELGQKLLGKRLIVIIDEERWTLEEAELVSLISVNLGGVDGERVMDEMGDFVKSVNREPQNAAFQFVDNRVEEFRPGRDGLRVLEDKFAEVMMKGVAALETQQEMTVGVPVERKAPAISTSEVNNLGIEKLLGRGESTYFHSIPNRVHNVALAAGRISGALVAPGETFSFNGTLGDVSQSTGFKSAYIISAGRTILGDGGGVCQVSTTLFRAALDAGLPIVERKAHAYRVGYYEQDSPPGIDATVYNPTADLKFLNDTPGYILIQTEVEPKNYYLKFEIYGTDDGRVVNLSKPRIWGQSSPPPALYQDDPTKPVGTVTQVDWAAPGAKTSFDYQVLNADGSVRYEETFYSNYRPWQAIFLKGTAVN